MKQKLFVVLALTFLIAATVPLQAQTPPGMTVECDNGASFDNGVEIVINQMRSGFNYQATAIGINGFDPVLAVLDTNSGEGLCNDDEPAAGNYAVDLPSTGRVNANNLSAQVTFSQNSSSAFADVSLVVGGFGNATGEFILILEGMGVTSGDGAGDYFSVNITPGMVNSGVPISTYMISRTNTLDPFMFLALPGSSDILEDGDGYQIYCDDAGNSNSCYGVGERLDNSGVSIDAGNLSGGQYDAMLTTYVDGVDLDTNRNNNFVDFYATSYNQSTQGQYVLVFHIGISDDGSTSTNSGSGSFGGGLANGQEQQGGNQPEVLPTQVVQQTTNNTPSGMTVECDNGATFDNGVEIVVNQMRSGFNYTATAVGINGFDPVLAVLDTATGEGLCSDDESSARSYAANLPSTGRVSASNLSSQVTFSQNSSSAFADVSLVVGGFGNASGEFILILEGMGVTSGDGDGDPFSVNITPGMIDSGVPITIYMMSRGTSGVDPLIYQAEAGSSTVLEDNNGNQVYCDDSGNSSSCYGTGERLDNYSVNIASGTLPGWQYDAMLTSYLDGLRLSAERTSNYFTYYMTSYQGSSQGQYLLVFHIGID